MNRFEILLVEEIPSLRRYALALSRDVSQADDLVQECLVRAISRRRLWISQKGIRPWLFTILHNIFVNTLRRGDNNRLFTTVEDYENFAVSGDDAESLCTMSDFEKSLQQLPSEQREVLLLIGVEQLSYKEVSKIVGIPTGTVMSRLSRAREHLRRNLKGDSLPAKIKRVK